MSPDFDSRRLDALSHLLLDGELCAESAEELRQILLGSAEARNHYRRKMEIHCALVRYGKDLQETPLFSTPVAVRKVKTQLTLLLATAACIIFGLMVFRKDPGPHAIMSGSTLADWGERTFAAGDSFPTDRTLSLRGGYAEVSFTSGVKVILQGPCRFEVNGPDVMMVTHGRASVRVPNEAGTFHLDTPGGRITDRGTEFGVAVGSGSEGAVVLTQVFDGEIEVPAKDAARKRLQAGDSRAIVRDDSGTRLMTVLDNYRVDLRDTARKLPAPMVRNAPGINIALGKPVFSPAYYSRPHGNQFPPETLTDGRLNDSGAPGDWSFWLAPNGEPGEFTVDLLENVAISRIELQNTRNRTYGDRGLREFAILVSDDNQNFREIYSGELSHILTLPRPGEDFPFESFTFEPVSTRYVKIVGMSHYRHPDRPDTDLDHGGGLNEIRIFAQ